MKKFIKVLISALVACVALLSLFGCGESKIDGKYLFEMAGGQANSPLTKITEKDENGNYVNVNHGNFVPENFWIEIKGDTMTIHGLIDPVVGGSSLKFNVTDSERVIENFKLETSTVNEAWYTVFNSKGEDTLWQILKDGKQIVFQFGESGGPELWYSISYNKA